MATLPNLLVTGFYKCGTSSLFKYLGAHPDIQPTKVKETYFLIDDDSLFRQEWGTIHDLGIDGFEKVHLPDGGTAKYILDVTSCYFCQQTAFQETLRRLARYYQSSNEALQRDLGITFPGANGVVLPNAPHHQFAKR